MTEKNRKRVLILDPNRDIAELFARALETGGGFKCYVTFQEEEALDILKDIPFDLLLVDFQLAWREDFAFLRKFKKLSPDTLIVLAAYMHQRVPLARAMELGAHGCLIKPIKIDVLRKKIEEFTLSRSTGDL